MTEEKDQSLKNVVGYVLSVRDSDRGATARIRAGLNPETEHRAYGEILPLLGPPISSHTETALLRSAALIASHPAISQLTEKSYPVGATFRKFSTELAKKRGAERPYEVDASNPDSVAFRLGQLPDQDLDSAALTLNRILALGEGLGVSIDYFNLARTLLHWGYGATASSIETRRTPLRDYYRYSQRPPTEKESK